MTMPRYTDGGFFDPSEVCSAYETESDSEFYALLDEAEDSEAVTS